MDDNLKQRIVYPDSFAVLKAGNDEGAARSA
jgi:hypothetical protein